MARPLRCSWTPADAAARSSSTAPRSARVRTNAPQRSSPRPPVPSSLQRRTRAASLCSSAGALETPRRLSRTSATLSTRATAASTCASFSTTRSPHARGRHGPMRTHCRFPTPATPTRATARACSALSVAPRSRRTRRALHRGRRSHERGGLRSRQTRCRPQRSLRACWRDRGVRECARILHLRTRRRFAPLRRQQPRRRRRRPTRRARRSCARGAHAQTQRRATSARP